MSKEMSRNVPPWLAKNPHLLFDGRSLLDIRTYVRTTTLESVKCWTSKLHVCMCIGYILSTFAMSQQKCLYLHI